MDKRGVWLQQGRLSADCTDFTDEEGSEQEMKREARRTCQGTPSNAVRCLSSLLSLPDL
jgi:hypothetical protein